MKNSPRWALRSSINVIFVAVTFGLLVGWLVAPDYVHARRTAAIGYFRPIPAPIAEIGLATTVAEHGTRSASLQLGHGFKLSKLSAAIDSPAIVK